MAKTIINNTSQSKPTFAELFTPKLISILKEGYTLANFRADAVAGLTVAIVALPLSMAIAIASGASPAQGLYTAIIGGFFVSIFGGSRFQIGGPAGAFIVLVSATVQIHGMEGLILATILSGLILAIIGFLQLGTYIKFIPYPVIVGFTSGIAVIIFSSQIKELLGLTLPGAEPAPLLEKIPVIWYSLPTAEPMTITLAIGTIGIICALSRLRPHWPGMLIAVASAALLTIILDLHVSTIGTTFGDIPDSFPMPSLPDVDIAKIMAVLPTAFAFALLGSIESLLSAVVADGMTGRRHRSNIELVAQGAANIASGLFGGICVTGTIARTVTNIRAGAHGPIAGILHAVFILIFILVAAPLASFIPLASLGGVLAIVAWNMIEKQAFTTLIRASRGDAAVLLSTFLLTIFRDLTEAIIVGFSLGSVLFIHRMSKVTTIETHAPFVVEDKSNNTIKNRIPYDRASVNNREILIYRISGAFFFGAAPSIGSVLDQIADTHRALIIDFTGVPFIDSTAANTIESLAHKAKRKNVEIYLTGTKHHNVGSELFSNGIKSPLVHYAKNIDEALTKLKKKPVDGV